MSQDQLLDHVETPPSLGEVAFQAIKKAILDKRLEPGVIYNERTIADELGFSKTPVHEALTALAVKGFITILPRKGFQVVGLTEKHIRDMYKFRRLLETAVIMDIVPKLTDESLDTIETYLKQIAVLAKNVEAGLADDTPDQLKKNPALRALYHNLQISPEAAKGIAEKRAPYTTTGDPVLDLALYLDKRVRQVRPDDWRGYQAREQVIKRALYEILQEVAEVERIFLIIKAQKDY